jgi:hypothetical protein
MNRLISLNLLLVLICAGCAGSLNYYPPTINNKPNPSIIIDQNRDTVWKKMVPALGKHFFVINNIDKSSGLINISYSGNPEVYIDCGRIVSKVSNLQGERTYDFPAARANQQYEIMKTNLYILNREMSLEGRMNLIFEEIGEDKTQVTAYTKYVVSKKVTVRNTGGGISQNFANSVSFNSDGIGTFPTGDGRETVCRPNGKFESDVLMLAK